jgi:hypothetical protein
VVLSPRGVMAGGVKTVVDGEPVNDTNLLQVL